MLDTSPLPDLTFPMVKLGRRETPWDLKPLLYQGGAAVLVNKVSATIDTGGLGSPRLERVQLVKAIHDAITGKIESGASTNSIAGLIESIRPFFSWAESAGHQLTLDAVSSTYFHWTDFLLHRVRVAKDLKENSAYVIALRVSGILDLVLTRATPLIHLSRFTRRSQRTVGLSVKADKQNLEWTFSFGHLLQDICDGLSIDKIWAPLPVCIPIRTAGTLEEWSKLKPANTRVVIKRDTNSRKRHAAISDEIRAAHENDRTLNTRYPLTNLRVESELLMFMGQTGMNLAQSHKLKVQNFYFSSDIDGYKVKARKNRRGGEVIFEIYKEYRAHFERYLDWRRNIFPDDVRLFPLIVQSRSDTKAPRFSRVRHSCSKLGISFVTPSVLRNTRINWLLRRSGDTSITAEMAQHTKETLLSVYEVPSLQRTMTETIHFWKESDPTMARTIPVAPGECNGSPKPMNNIPENVAPPDCVRASGCLWCEHHRDIDNQDYVWSLGCFRHLKVIEVSKYRAPREKDTGKHPAEHAITRLSEKLRWFRDSNERRRGWVEEALALIEEGNYHPDWVRLIQNAEGVPS